MSYCTSARFNTAIGLPRRPSGFGGSFALVDLFSVFWPSIAKLSNALADITYMCALNDKGSKIIVSLEESIW